MTVFPEGAQVTRIGQAAVPAGRTELIFGGISPYADPSSIQVSATGAFTILSVSPQPNKLREQKKRKEILEIEKSKEGLNKQLTLETAKLDVYNKEEQMLEDNNKIGGANTGVSAADLSAALDLHRTRLKELKTIEIEYGEKIQAITDTLRKIDEQIKALNNNTNLSTTDIVVNILANEAVSGDFVISYVVANAGWYPSYDLHVDDITKPLTLNYKANVHQNTGEEWKDVKIIFSNGTPNESGVAPDLVPLVLKNHNFGNSAYIYPVNPNIREVSGRVFDEKGEPIIAAAIGIVGSSIGTVTDFDGNYKLQIPPGSSQLKVSYVGYTAKIINISSAKLSIYLDPAESLNEVVVVSRYKKKLIGGKSEEEKPGQYIDKDQKSNIYYSDQTKNMTSITFELATPYTVINDGKNRAVDMKSEDIPATFEYFCVPKIEKKAYLIAHVNNWLDYNLMDGEVNLYYENTYTGKTVFSLANAEDTLSISLGQDKGITVSRTQVKEFSKKQILSDKKSASTGYEIAIRNNKKFPVHLTVEDQLPISSDKEISIENSEYEGATLDEPSGKLTWKLNLEPAKDKKLKLSYTVKYPKSYRIQID